MTTNVGPTRIDRIEGDAMLVNSYLVHGPDGLIVVDGQLTVPDADKVRRAIDATGRPVAGMLVTHPHPDHYAGAARMLGGLDAPMIATPAVDAVIRRDDAEKDTIVGPMMGTAWPDERRFPDVLVEPGTSISLGGLELTARDLGPGESHSDTLWLLDELTVIAGDVAYNDMHAYLADGEYDGWLHTLRLLDKEMPDDVVLYVGHGEPAGRELLAAQRVYVEEFVAAVSAAAGLDPDARQAAVTAQMRRLLPNDRLQFLMELSIEPVRAGLS